MVVPDAQVTFLRKFPRTITTDGNWHQRLQIMHRRAFLTLAGAMTLGTTASRAESAYYEGAEYVAYDTWENPGTIIIDTHARWLYLILGDGEATRYGVAVGKD